MIEPPRKQRPRGFITAWEPKDSTRLLLDNVRSVLAEYRDYLPLTCRQIFYRLVGAYDFEKTEKSYKRLCEALNRARRARLIDFSVIRDDDAPMPRTMGHEDEAGVVATLKGYAETFNLDRQSFDTSRPFIVLMCEAKGMVPQLERVASGFSVPVLGSGGFDSVTFKHGLARLAGRMRREVEIIHIGDHDPSGVHVFANLEDDVGTFAAQIGARVTFDRLAVTEDIAIDLDLPTAPAKATDRRAFEGIGGDPEATVQAEAVPPDEMARLVEQALSDRIPEEQLEEADREEARIRAKLTELLGGLL